MREGGVNSILTIILRFWPTSWKNRTFCLVASFLACREDHFQQKSCPKRTFPSDVVKLGSEIVYLFLAEKMVVCCCCCLFCLLQLCPILAYFFILIEALIELRKMLLRKELFDVQFGNCSTPKVLNSAEILDLQRCNWPNFCLDGRSVLDNLF